jgi:hypothetical protein
MYEGMDGFTLEDLADEEQAAIGQQGQTSPAAVAMAPQMAQAAPPGVAPGVQQQPTQTPLYSQQWQQWDAARQAGNLMPVPVAPMTQAPAQPFPWAKVLVGAGIAAAVVYGVIKMRKGSKKSNPKSSGSWQTIGD